MMGSNNNKKTQFGDTTLTKVFVGGLAWETPKDTLRDHFQKYGDILEAVIISDKITGRSKGYGFVTFKEVEAANKACQLEPSFIINGRQANCNIASLGARRPTTTTTTTTTRSSTSPPSQVQWYYPTPTPTPPAASPFHPFYGYTPTYIATDHMNYNYNYNQKLSYGGYVNNNNVYPGIGIVLGGNTLMPMIYYPAVYPYNFFHPTHHAPAIASSITPSAVGTGECLIKRVV